MSRTLEPRSLRRRHELGRLGVLAALVGFGACGPPRAAVFDEVLGTPRDLRTPAGPHEGFRVERDCQLSSCIGVTGTGQRWYPGMDRGVGEATGFEALRHEMLAALAGLRSVTSTGLGVACHADAVGLVIGLADWHEFDAAIDRIGARLLVEDLREPITICAEPDAVLMGGAR